MYYADALNSNVAINAIFKSLRPVTGNPAEASCPLWAVFRHKIGNVIRMHYKGKSSMDCM